MIIPEIFLFIAVLVLVIPSIYYWIYPHPENIKLQKTELFRLHEERLLHIKNEIELAKKHYSNGTKVYGSSEPWAQAERYELALQDKLNLENATFNQNIKDIEKFPLTDALVIFGIFLTLIGLYK